MAAGETDHERAARAEEPGEGGGKLRLRDRAERSLGGRLAEGGEGLRLLGLVCQLTIDELEVVVAQGPRLSQHIGCGSRLVIPRSPGACAAGVEGSVTGTRSVIGEPSACGAMGPGSDGQLE